jgi:hypothetical protein
LKVKVWVTNRVINSPSDSWQVNAAVMFLLSLFSDKYEVIDHVARNMTDVKQCDEVNCPPEISKQQSKLAFIVALLNADKYTEYLFLCSTE